jgi:membrane associated rhomboid family serine protease
MTPWVTRLLFANVAMFLVSRAVPGTFAALALVPGLMPFRPWTALSYMFLHANLMHLVFNMLGLFFFGPRLEQRIGSARFLWLYLVSGFAGAVLSLATPNVPIVGASGAVFGVFLGFARYWPRSQVLIWGIIPVEARVLVVIMTALALLGGFGAGQRGVAHFAHLGGFIGGWLYLRWIEARSAAAAFRRASAPRAAAARPDSVDRWRRIDRRTLHPINAEELDRVLAKIDAAGLESLTADERAFLDRLSPR